MRGFKDYRRSLAMADYYAEKARIEREHQDTERRIMGGGYVPGRPEVQVSEAVKDS